jgi:hypothetical protein
MKTTTTTKIGSIRRISSVRCYSRPVYRPLDYGIGEIWGDDWTGENPAAHGGITYTEEESYAGRQRQVNANGEHIEVGPWGPTRAQREAHA